MRNEVGELLQDSILVDVTAFSSAIRRSGIERVISALGRVSEEYALVPFRIKSRGEIEVLSPDYFAHVRGFFDHDASGFDSLRRSYHPTCERTDVPTLRIKLIPQVVAVVAASHAASLCQSILNWTYVLHPVALDFYFDRLEDARDKLHFLAIDFLFWTHYECFQSRASEDVGHTRYLMLLRRLSKICFISKHAEGEFIRRIAKNGPGTYIIAHPGSDALGTRAPNGISGSLMFVVVGTVEPRKMSGLIVRAASRVTQGRHTVSVHFLGALSPLLMDDERKIFQAVRNGAGPIRWTENPTDSELRDAISSARALICLSSGEGYAAPPTEALALGVPCITSENLPCREAIGNSGQVVIPHDDEDALVHSIESFCDDRFTASKVAEISSRRLPTWDGFARRLLDWACDYRNGDATSLAHYRRAYIRVSFGDCDDEGDYLATSSDLATQHLDALRHHSRRLSRPAKALWAEASEYAVSDARSTKSLVSTVHNARRLELHDEKLTLDPAEYLEWLALEYLGRKLSEPERSLWLSPDMQLEHPIRAIASFASCDEAVQLKNDPFRDSWIEFVRDWSAYEVVLGASDEPVRSDLLVKCYNELLGRAPDYGSWRPHINVRASCKDTIASFLLSDEHLQRIRNLDAYWWALKRVGFSVPGLQGWARSNLSKPELALRLHKPAQI